MTTDNERIVRCANDLLEAFTVSDYKCPMPSLQVMVNGLGEPMRTTMGSELGELLLSIAEELATPRSVGDTTDQLADRSQLYEELLMHSKTLGRRIPTSR